MRFCCHKVAAAAGVAAVAAPKATFMHVMEDIRQFQKIKKTNSKLMKLRF